MWQHVGEETRQASAMEIGEGRLRFLTSCRSPPVRASALKAMPGWVQMVLDGAIHPDYFEVELMRQHVSLAISQQEADEYRRRVGTDLAASALRGGRAPGSPAQPRPLARA